MTTPAPAPAEPAVRAATAQDAPAAAREPAWYRIVVRAADGIEIPFFLGVPPPGTPGDAVLKVGEREVRTTVTFDGKTLRVPFDIHQTAVAATVGEGGSLAGSFSTSLRVFGASAVPLTGTPVAAPATSALATVAGGAAALDLKEPRSVWRLALGDAGTAKLVLDQQAPGDFAGILYFDTGNIVYLAGNGRGDALVLTGFDGTASYRLELALGGDRKRARGKWLAGHKLDWREALTATRGADFRLVPKPRPVRPGGKITLPDLPALAALPRGPLLVELSASWCSACKSSAPSFVELYREYQPRGLQMVTLLYELTDDPALDAKQAEAFKQTYGLSWPVIPVPGGVEDFGDILPRGLSGVDFSGFPIALFLAPDRSVVGLHAGFPAADAAEGELRRVKAELRAHAEALLAKQPASPAGAAGPPAPPVN